MRYLAAHLVLVALLFVMFFVVALAVAGWGSDPVAPHFTA